MRQGYRYLRDRLSLQWRRWLTHRFVDNYFRARLLQLNTSNTDIDNPDQRIEDVRSFTQESLTFAGACGISSVGDCL